MEHRGKKAAIHHLTRNLIAEREFKAWRLAEELKKRVVRVNALKKYEKAIKETRVSLKEVEWEFLIVVKKAKER